ncbi:hypothetical protein CL673_07405 [Candidatus Bathyarchaeota archaeon]|jgi:hypothetical protein|nr:hypothetical protein [Candidatus Bathyarchaeota archaeon]
MIIRTGREFEVLILLVMIVYYVYWLMQSTGGKSIPELRNFPAIDAIEEGVGRSVETDKPVHFGLGDASRLGGDRAAGTISALNFLSYTATLCARTGANLIVRISPNPHLYAQADAIVSDAYAAEGKQDELDKVSTLRYYGDYRGYMTGGIRDMVSLGTAMNVTMGALSVETVWAYAICRAQGGIGVGGGSRWGMIFGLAMLADYALLGDEMYAASAKVSNDSDMAASFIGGDWMKFTLVALTIITSLAYFVGAQNLVAWMFI